MKTINLFSKQLSLCVFILAFSCILATSCIKDADDEGQPKPPAIDTIPDTDSTLVVVDSVFKPSAEYMHGEWMAQYVGFDLRQMKTSSIRRLVFFSPDGYYDSHVQGIVDIEDSITAYKEFEHEHGMYSFDASRQLMKYTVEYDSLLNFGSDQLEYNPGKMRLGVGLVKEYYEEIWFSKEKDGKRDWVRKDDNLVSADNHSANIIYIMKNH